ncbi:hypothetical protein OFB63_36000, partial [Escherichia coli]|nr:hypothetical protein [Escherichia coli]
AAGAKNKYFWLALGKLLYHKDMSRVPCIGVVEDLLVGCFMGLIYGKYNIDSTYSSLSNQLSL